MFISKNKKYQYIFCFILIVYTLFNGGNSNILIQINFILVSFLFLFCLKDKNYKSHLKSFYNNNEKSIIFYLIFLLYLIFQITPLPIDMLKFFSPEKYKFLNLIDLNNYYFSISLSPTDSFFQILNFISIILVVFILKMIFYTDRHKKKFYIFFSILGFVVSTVAIIFYFNDNPDFLIFKNSYYKNASSGFFINRTVFAVFLLFSLVSCLELLRKLNINNVKKKDNFFLKIYIRLFVIFIAIGIITSFSRIGNFLFFITILFYLVNEYFYTKYKNNSFKILIIFILLIDILILGFYFGGSKIIGRFYFLSDEFAELYTNNNNLSRLDIAKFSLLQIKDYLFFGYGAGSYEYIFKIYFFDLGTQYANHAHSDIIEFLGEFGLFGSVLIFISLVNFFKNKNSYSFSNLIVITYMFVILIFDFSLHIPLIQLLFVIFLTLNQKISAKI